MLTGEAAHGVDGLVREVVVGCGVVLDQLSVLHLVTLPDSVDLLVDLSSVVVALLTSSGHSVLDPAGMPSSNTSDLPQTLVSLSGQLLSVPPGGDALKTVALGHTNHVNHLVLGEHRGDGNLLLEMVPGEVNLVRDGATVELNLHDVRLLLPPSKDLLLTEVIGPLSAGLGEGFLLGLRPVLVESPLGLLADVLSPDSLESPESPGGLDIADHTNSNEGRGLDDGHSLHNLLLVNLGAGSVHLSHDVSHAGLVSEEGGHVDGL